MVRIAMVQPRTAFGENARKANMEDAREFVKIAADDGAQLVCFPETYPGLWRAPVDWTPVEELAELAAAHRIHIIAGYAEPSEQSSHRCYNTLSLLDPSGSELGRYRRTSPEIDPWIYRDGDLWGFTWVRAAELPVFTTSIGTIGMAVCSEIYATEIARGLALQGAELLFFPAGTLGPSNPLFSTWRTLGWARAIENIACTFICSNVIGPDGDGLTLVSTPEDIVFESHDAGIHVVDVDLERVRWLRAQQDGLITKDAPYRTKPGLLRDWRRAAVLEANRAVFDPSSRP